LEHFREGETVLLRTHDIELQKLVQQLKIEMHRVVFEMPEYWCT
jgi:hypothetical protein